MNPTQLNAIDPTAFEALVDIWSEQSRCSRTQAAEDLRNDVSGSYRIDEPSEEDFFRGFPREENIGMKYRFYVDFSGEVYYYNPEARVWVFRGWI